MRRRWPPRSIRSPQRETSSASSRKAGAGRYGFFEALDYTPRRVPQGQTVAVVRAFMAHHQGMTIVAIADALLDGAMRGRFHAEPMMRAAELLLQERMPREIAVHRLGRAMRPPRRGSGSSIRRLRAARRSPCRDAGDASSLQRPLQRHADRRRLGLQPLAGPGGHALAGGRHLRRLGILHLLQGCRERPVWSAGRPDGRRAGPLRRTFSADRAPSRGGTAS